jgi:hypothetical protein
MAQQLRKQLKEKWSKIMNWEGHERWSMICFSLLFQNLPRDAEEDHEKSSVSTAHGRRAESFGYKAGALQNEAKL